ncbi:MAG: YdcF family protein [Lachnospiraceae bacterium]|nr:YdcF family protein [Lachnospiraceae bacterium]
MPKNKGNQTIHKKKIHNKKAARVCLRLFLVGIGGLGLLWLMVPVIVGRIVNIGTVTGILIFGMVAGYGLFMGWCNRVLENLWKKKAGKIILSILMGIACIILALVIILTTNMIIAAGRKPEENATVIILGCRVYGEYASLSLLERLQAAEEYLKEHPEAVCILSGGQGPGEDISEAECMYRYLTEQGISPEQLYLEDKSTSTRENMAFSKTIIEEQGFSTKVAIVTNEYHEYRASIIARNQGLEPASVPASTAVWLFPAYYVRELYGILYEWVF